MDEVMDEVYEYLCAHPGATVTEMAAAGGMGRESAVRKKVQFLVRVKKVRSRGTVKRTSVAGYPYHVRRYEAVPLEQFDAASAARPEERGRGT
jgi:predicted transcriptional regulator